MKETMGLIKNQVSSELKSESNVNIKRDQKNIKTHSLNQSGQYYKMQCFLLDIENKNSRTHRLFRVSRRLL